MFSIADIAQAIGEEPDSIRKLFLRQFVRPGIVSEDRRGARHVRFQVRPDRIAQIEGLLRDHFPLRPDEQSAAERIVTQLRYLEATALRGQAEVAERRVILDSVFDLLGRELVRGDVVADVGDGLPASRPVLVAWYLLQESLQQLLLDQGDEWQVTRRRALATLDEVATDARQRADLRMINFLEERRNNASKAEALLRRGGVGDAEVHAPIGQTTTDAADVIKRWRSQAPMPSRLRER